jgi:hypothetical protein
VRRLKRDLLRLRTFRKTLLETFSNVDEEGAGAGEEPMEEEDGTGTERRGGSGETGRGGREEGEGVTPTQYAALHLLDDTSLNFHSNFFNNSTLNTPSATSAIPSSFDLGSAATSVFPSPASSAPSATSARGVAAAGSSSSGFKVAQVPPTSTTSSPTASASSSLPPLSSGGRSTQLTASSNPTLVGGSAGRSVGDRKPTGTSVVGRQEEEEEEEATRRRSAQKVFNLARQRLTFDQYNAFVQR